MECMICTEDLLLGSVGELDCCEHRYILSFDISCDFSYSLRHQVFSYAVGPGYQ